jgi:hypothetical protein
MAVVTGTIVDAFGITTPMGPLRDGNSPPLEIKGLYFTATFSGTYAQGDNAQLLLVPTVLASHITDGRTFTLLSCALAQPGLEAGTVIGAKTIAISGTTITMELTGADLTTEHANAVLGTMTRPICFFISLQMSGG